MSSQGLSGRPALSKTSGSSLDESMGPSMHRQPPLNGPIQVVGHAAPPGLLALWPITAGRDHHAKPTLHDRDQRCHGPARAVDGAGTGPVPLAARGAPAQARRATCSQSSRFPVIAFPCHHPAALKICRGAEVFDRVWTTHIVKPVLPMRAGVRSTTNDLRWR
jgi:hypothetical protein